MKRIVEFSQSNQLNIRLAYYPPYHSKYNPIERTWAVLKNYWNGSILDEVETIVLSLARGVAAYVKMRFMELMDEVVAKWIQNKQIAIVGGGPGGLTLARLLQLKGANVKVYERDFNKEARMVGSPLDMHEGSGMAALRKANLLSEFKNNFRPGADKMVIVNERAEIFFSDHGTKPDEDFDSEHFRPEIDRGPLRNMLLESLQLETVVWDSHFISMEKQNVGWLLHFKSGSSAYADIVIAADGANSKIRP
jgi:hypothetical protein